MKKAIMTIVLVLSVSLLSGCAGSLVRSGYNLAVTPETDVCEAILGKTYLDAEKQLNMGKPDSIKSSTIKQTRIYTKGNLKAILNIDNSKVAEASCYKM